MTKQLAQQNEFPPETAILADEIAFELAKIGHCPALLVYCLLDDATDGASMVELSLVQLAEWLGRSEKTVQRSIRELRDRGLIKTKLTGRELIFEVWNPIRRPQTTRFQTNSL
jgi:hypothetical protein